MVAKLEWNTSEMDTELMLMKNYDMESGEKGDQRTNLGG